MTDGPDDELDEYFSDSKSKADNAFNSGVDKLGTVMSQDEAERPRVVVKLDVGFLYAAQNIEDNDPRVSMIMSITSGEVGGGDEADVTVQPYIVHELQILSFALNALLTFCDEHMIMVFMQKVTEVMAERERDRQKSGEQRDSATFAMDMLRLIESIKDIGKEG